MVRPVNLYREFLGSCNWTKVKRTLSQDKRCYYLLDLNKGGAPLEPSTLEHNLSPACHQGTDIKLHPFDQAHKDIHKDTLK